MTKTSIGPVLFIVAALVGSGAMLGRRRRMLLPLAGSAFTGSGTPGQRNQAWRSPHSGHRGT